MGRTRLLRWASKIILKQGSLRFAAAGFLHRLLSLCCETACAFQRPFAFCLPSNYYTLIHSFLNEIPESPVVDMVLTAVHPVPLRGLLQQAAGKPTWPKILPSPPLEGEQVTYGKPTVQHDPTRNLTLFGQ